MDFAIQGSRPIWQQRTEQLARRIITGAYPLGARFPAVRELAAEAGVDTLLSETVSLPAALEARDALMRWGTVSVEVPGAGVVDTLIHSIMRIKGVQRAFRINN